MFTRSSRFYDLIYSSKNRLGLFTEEEMRGAFEKGGLAVEFDPVGLEDRGLYIGTRTCAGVSR